MSETSPQPNAGSDEEKEKIRHTIAMLGLTGAANDVKWGRLIDAMRTRDDWTPSYRFNCVDSDYVSPWDVEWWYHLPFPMVSVRWFDIGCWQEVGRGRLLEPEIIDHSDWILPLLDEIGFCYDMVGEIVRLHGYLPKSFDGLEDLIENQQ